MFPFFDLSTRPSICPSILEPSLRSFILSIFSFVCSPVHSFTLIRSCVLSFVRSSVLSLLRSFFRSFPCLFVRSSFLSSFVRSPFRSFVRLFICSLHLYFLQEKDQGSRLAVMKINTKRKDALPIIDIAPTHIGKTGEPFRLEIGPVCFMF